MSRPVAPSDQMRAAGSGRRKVALPPGRSQLDWVRKQLKISPSRPRTISIAELRRHSSRHDAWLAVDSHVYDVTSYVEYHPGGIDMLLAGVGKVCQALLPLSIFFKNKYQNVAPDMVSNWQSSLYLSFRVGCN